MFLPFPSMDATSAGISAVRCSWGGAQEAAALAQLAATFPDAAVEEVRCAHVAAIAHA